MIRFKYLCVLLCVGGCIAAAVTLVDAQQNQPAAIARPNPNDILRSAQTIFIRTKSVYFKPAALEQKLLERDEIQQWGFVISREESDADLIIEVDRKLFTSHFVYSVIDPKAGRVLLAGNINSIGGTVEGKIADGFVKRLKRVRPLERQSGGETRGAIDNKTISALYLITAGI